MLQKNIEKIIIGAALAVSASALIPIVKSTLRPLAASGAEGSGTIMDRARSLGRLIREEAEDIVAEAQFERMKKRIDLDIAAAGGDRI